MLTAEEISFYREHRQEDVRQLALRGVSPALLQQIQGWQRARTKLPEIAARDDWYYPVQLSMEQCSGEVTARYKSDLCRRLLPHSPERERVLVDLTGGFGIDCYYVGRSFEQVHYVERNEALCQIAAHNMPHIHVHHTDSVVFLQQMEHADAILIDPARRDDCGRKVAGLSDCTPDLTQLHPLLCQKADIVLVKLSPMLDWHEAIRQLPETREVHIVSVQNECKELLLVLQSPSPIAPSDEIGVHCINIPNDPPFLYTIRRTCL